MRKIAIFLFLISLITGCESDNTPLPDNCIPVKYVRGLCGNAVLQIQDLRYFSVGENVDGETHVFLATLECFTDLEAAKDKVFYVELNPSDFNSDCAVCLAMINYTGNKHYAVRVHEACNDNQE